jgi:hypothetical protein
MRYLNVYCIFLLVVVSSFRSFSQTSCNERFDEAQRAYYTGDVRRVETILDGCIEMLDKNRQEQAMRLIILSNLTLRDQQKADSAMLQLLLLNPIYLEQDMDPPEFVRLLNTYNRTPVFSVGIKGGLNWGSYEVIQEFSIASNKTDLQYSAKTGYQLGLYSIYHLLPQCWLGLEFNYERRILGSSESFLENQEIVATEYQSILDIPFSARYVYPGWKFKPYIEAGGSISILLSSNCDLTRISANRLTLSKEFDFTDYRGNINYRVFGGIGVARNIRRGILGVSFRYGIDLLSMTKNSPDYNDPELILTYGFLSNDIKASAFSISIYYLRSFYKPRKFR